MNKNNQNRKNFSNIPVYLDVIVIDITKNKVNRSDKYWIKLTTGAFEIRGLYLDQAYSNTRVPTQVNTSEHKSTRVNSSPARVNTSSTRVNTNQHESKTSQHESDTVQHKLTTKSDLDEST